MACPHCRKYTCYQCKKQVHDKHYIMMFMDAVIVIIKMLMMMSMMMVVPAGSMIGDGDDSNDDCD